MCGKLDLSVIILTGNEEIHIKRCLDRICDVAKTVFVVDCFSDDNTVKIAEEYPEVIVLKNKWVNYATQFNWALENAPIKTSWVLRLDADEYLEEETKNRLIKELHNLPEDISAIDLKLKHIFLGKLIKGGTGTKYLTRLFRYGKAKSEIRQMDEHLEVIEGRKVIWQEAFCDHNLNNKLRRLVALEFRFVKCFLPRPFLPGLPLPGRLVLMLAVSFSLFSLRWLCDVVVIS